MLVRAPILMSAAALAGAAILGGCGGGGDKPAAPEVSTVPAPPAANIDPNADGVLTGPINRARNTAGDAERRSRELDQQTSSSVP